jgi:hypothetical protein
MIRRSLTASSLLDLNHHIHIDFNKTFGRFYIRATDEFHKIRVTGEFELAYLDELILELERIRDNK